MKRLYLIGPVTGKPNDNREAFEEASARLEAEGYAVDIPPHLHQPRRGLGLLHAPKHHGHARHRP